MCFYVIYVFSVSSCPDHWFTISDQFKFTFPDSIEFLSDGKILRSLTLIYFGLVESCCYLGNFIVLPVTVNPWFWKTFFLLSLLRKFFSAKILFRSVFLRFKDLSELLGKSQHMHTYLRNFLSSALQIEKLCKKINKTEKHWCHHKTSRHFKDRSSFQISTSVTFLTFFINFI